MKILSLKVLDIRVSAPAAKRLCGNLQPHGSLLSFIFVQPDSPKCITDHLLIKAPGNNFSETFSSLQMKFQHLIENVIGWEIVLILLIRL